MSAKVKLISIISAFVLVLGIMIIGVLSAEQVKVNIGGSVSFNATNVYARVTGSVIGSQSDPTLSELLFTAEDENSPSASALATWSDMDLDFDDTPSPIEIEIIVENLSTQRTLTVNLTNTLSASGLNIAITRDTASYTSATNVELGTAGSSTDSTTFTLTLTVANPNEDLTDANFGYILNMYDESVAPVDLSAFTFTTSGDNATLTSYTGTDTDVVIPSTISFTSDGTTIEGSDYTVTAIASGSYFGGPFYSVRSTLISVTIPSSVTSIGNYAFGYCDYLNSVTFEDNSQLTSINSSVFFNCYSLASVTIPENVTSIGSFAFSGCTSLTSIIIPSSVTSIGELAFQDCRILTSITIGEGVTSIGEDAFNICYSLNTIEVDSANTAYTSEDGILFNKDKTTLIAYPAGNTRTSYIVPSSVTTIGAHAFSHCRNLTSITITEGVSNIDEETFSDCDTLVSITIPEGVTSIGNSAFSACSNLNSITIPNSVTSIGNSAFSNCSSLTSIIIPNSVTSIGNSVFAYCDSLTSIIIPGSVTSIGTSVFSYCDSLTSVTISSNITSIGNSVFNGCSSLTSITIPNSVTSIGNSAFSNCSSLTSITIPADVASIGSSAFNNCYALAEVYNYSNLTITQGTSNSSVGYLGQYAKVVYNASNLTGNKPASRITEINDVQYYNYGSDFIALAPAVARGALTDVSLDSRTTEINRSAFNDCNSLASIIIPEGVTSIGFSAFNGCRSLTSITIPSSVTSIDSAAFSSCYALAEIYNYSDLTVNLGETSSINNGYLGQYAKVVYNAGQLTGDKPATRITVIDNMQYYSYNDDFIALAPTSRNVTEVTLDNRTTEINRSTFNDCNSLASIIIPEGVTSIGDSAFEYCSSLTSITIPEGVTSIGRATFDGCSSLTLITIPEGVISIGSYAFQSCVNLSSITIPSSITSIGVNVFYSCIRLTSVTFENKTGWFATSSSTATSGTNIDVSDPERNATLLVEIYGFYSQYWKRS